MCVLSQWFFLFCICKVWCCTYIFFQYWNIFCLVAIHFLYISVYFLLCSCDILFCTQISSSFAILFIMLTGPAVTNIPQDNSRLWDFPLNLSPHPQVAVITQNWDSLKQIFEEILKYLYKTFKQPWKFYSAKKKDQAEGRSRILKILLRWQRSNRILKDRINHFEMYTGDELYETFSFGRHTHLRFSNSWLVFVFLLL